MSKGSRLLRLFPKFFKTDSKINSNATGDIKGPLCYIVFLDDSEQTFVYKNSWKGQTLFNQVCELINVSEKIYFGLRFVDATGQAHWLDFGKSLVSQLKGCTSNPRLYFGVKFYAADPCKLQEEITRYLFFLQVKRDILQGRLPVSFEEAAELCAYAVQSELGDFDSRYHTPGYVSEFSFLPSQTEELEARIAGMHRRCQGATPVMAEQKFLEKVKWLEMYGVDLHPVQDAGNMEYYLGLTPTGIVVFKHRTKIASYFWPRVTKASRKSKIFTIRVKDKHNDERTFAFELSTKAACKHLWKCCLEHHTFFSERAERLAAYEARSRDEPRVQRAPSRRKARRVNSDSRLNTERLYQDQYASCNRSVITVVSQPESLKAPRHRSLPELQDRQSPRSVKSAPWESKFDHGLYTSGHDSPTSGRQVSFISVGSDSESGISQRKRYFPNRKSSDNESDVSASRRRRHEIESDSASEVSFMNSHQNRRNRFGDRNLKTSDSHISHPCNDKGNSSHGSIPSVHSAPAGEVRQRRRRRRSKSPGNSKRPPEELKQHIEFDLVDTQGMTEEQLRDIAYTKIETKANVFRIKYSPKFRHKIWASRRKSFGDADKHSRPVQEGADNHNLSVRNGYDTDPYKKDSLNNKTAVDRQLVDNKHARHHQGMTSPISLSDPSKDHNSLPVIQRNLTNDGSPYSDSCLRRNTDNLNFTTSQYDQSSVREYQWHQKNNEQNRFSYHEESRKTSPAQFQQSTNDKYSQNHVQASNYNPGSRNIDSDREIQFYSQPGRHITRPDSHNQFSKQDSYNILYSSIHSGSAAHRSSGHLSDSYYSSVEHSGQQKQHMQTLPPKYGETGLQKGASSLPRFKETQTLSPPQRGLVVSQRYPVANSVNGRSASPHSAARINFDQWSTPLRPDSHKSEKQDLPTLSQSGHLSSRDGYTGSPNYQNGTSSYGSSPHSKGRYINGSFQPQFCERQQSSVSQCSSGHASESPRRSPYSHSVSSAVKPTVRQGHPQLQQSNKLRSDLVTQI
ncbi:hypothetical protein BsWGS_02039 [Bradybaena similaris]